MSDAQYMAAAMLAGFIVYLAANRRLVSYWRILTGGAA